MRLMICVLGRALGGLTAFSADGEALPTRNVTILVPFAAGRPTDVIMRILGERLTARWGKSVIIENRPGAGTIVATAALAKAVADGHTPLGVLAKATSPQELDSIIRKEIERWTAIAKAANITVDQMRAGSAYAIPSKVTLGLHVGC